MGITLAIGSVLTFVMLYFKKEKELSKLILQTDLYLHTFKNFYDTNDVGMWLHNNNIISRVSALDWYL